MLGGITTCNILLLLVPIGHRNGNTTTIPDVLLLFMCMCRILSIEFTHKIKTFSDKQKPRQFTSSFSLKKLLKDILQREGK